MCGEYVDEDDVGEEQKRWFLHIAFILSSSILFFPPTPIFHRKNGVFECPQPRRYTRVSGLTRKVVVAEGKTLSAVCEGMKGDILSINLQA